MRAQKSELAGLQMSATPVPDFAGVQQPGDQRLSTRSLRDGNYYYSAPFAGETEELPGCGTRRCRRYLRASASMYPRSSSVMSSRRTAARESAVVREISAMLRASGWASKQ